MEFICYPKCSTCKKAMKYLDNHNYKYSVRDITLDVPSKKELSKFIKMSGKDINNFFNTSGLKYRELKLKDKLNDMSLSEKLELLSSDGMLIKRPILVSDNFVLVGFREKEWSDSFENSKM